MEDCEKSEQQLYAELHRTRSVGPHRMEKAVAHPAAGRPRGEPRALVTVTTDRVAGGVALIGIVEDELRVVKKVERFYTKLQEPCFATEREGSQQRKIKIRTAGVVQEVSACVALRQASGSDEHTLIPQERTKRLRTAAGNAPDIRNDIRVRIRAQSQSEAGVIQLAEAGGIGSVDYIEWRSRLEECNPRDRPAAEQNTCNLRWTSVRRQG